MGSSPLDDYLNEREYSRRVTYKAKLETIRRICLFLLGLVSLSLGTSHVNNEALEMNPDPTMIWLQAHVTPQGAEHISPQDL